MLLVPEVQLRRRTVHEVLVTQWCEPPGGGEEWESGERKKGERIEREERRGVWGGEEWGRRGVWGREE